MNALDTGVFAKLNIPAITSLLAGTTSAFPSAIYANQAAEGAILPYIVFNIQGGGDENDNPHRTKNQVLFIRAYATTKKIAGSIDAAIDTALHLVPFDNVSGWIGTWLARETDLETVENPPTGTKIFMVGGLYRSRLTK